MLQAEPAQYAVLRAAGVDAVTVTVAWNRAEPDGPGLDDRYLGEIDDRYRSARDSGLEVALSAGLNYPPSWVFELPGGTRFVDQTGQQWRGGVGDAVADAVFNPAVRGAQDAYLERLARRLEDHQPAGIRVGGLAWGELHYPPSHGIKPPNTFWAFGAAALSDSPVPGFRPGRGSQQDAAAFLDWYLSSLAGYGRWQLDTYRRHFGPQPRLLVLEPSWGTLGGYATYVMALVLAGQGDDWFLQKTRGVRRVLGLTQATGFNREGSVSLVSRVLANLSNFAMTYAVIGSGLLATLWLLHRLRRGDVPGSARAAVVLLVVWSLSATANLAYAVTLGTLEEQMFYLLVVTAVPVVFVAAHAVHPRGRRLRAALIVGLALALATNASVWSRTHTVPDDGYARFLGWAQTGLPRDSTVAATDETSQFVLPHAHVLRLTTGNELRTHHADYVLVVSVLVEQGYSDVDREFLDIVGRGRVVFRSTGPTSGDLTLYDVSGVTG